MRTLNPPSHSYGAAGAQRSTLNAQWVRLMLVVLSAFVSQTGGADFSSDLAEASKPLAQGVPEVAVVRLRGLLATKLSDADWRVTAEKLVEALLEANQPGEALSLLEDARLGQGVKFWRAQALADLRRPAEALSIYEQVAAEGGPLSKRAVFGAAEMLRALKRRDEALQKYATLRRDPDWNVRARLRSAEVLLDKGELANARRILEEMQPKTAAEKQERQVLRSRLSITDRPQRAIDVFHLILQKPEGATHAVLLTALFGSADAYLQLKTPESGDDVLEDFIDHHPQDVDLAFIFAKLDQLYHSERSPSRSELERWVREVDQPRRAFAQWYLARIELRAGNRDRAAQLFAALWQSKPKTPELATALLEFAQLEMQDGNFRDAISILAEARVLEPKATVLDQINLLAGQAQYRAREFDAAAATFDQVANSPATLAKTAVFNASLVRLQSGNRAQFPAVDADPQKQPGDENSRAELRLEEGLIQASKGDKNAADSLRAFLRNSPDDKRAAEAWVALAELAFHAAPPRLDEARKDLTRAAELKPTAEAMERVDYLLIWIEDSTRTNDAKVIELAKKFLEQHGESKMASEVRLKLAEEYYRRQDFPNAQTQFETLAEANGAGALKEKALFFAAKSAVSSMAPHALDHAISLFDQVVRMNGEMKWAARNEQAAIERKLGKPADALTMYEEVLKNEARPEEKREALCGKGDIFFEMGGSDSKNYRRAIDVYDELAGGAGKQVQWRNQALFKKGLCLEKEADRPGALATFFTVLDVETRPDRPNELFWFYKAGFNAARLLEDDAKWESAAAIYEKLVAADGLRSEEAKSRLSRLRLEHFLWQD
jgi:predicted negative regulator of RcsB-dependent stress response